MWMPAGVSQITASCDGADVDMYVLCDEETARAAQRSLDLFRTADGRKPFFDFDHEEKEASAWPDSYEFRPGAGVFTACEWSEGGRNAIKGKSHRGFSPAFLTDKQVLTKDGRTKVLPTSPSDPARVILLPLCQGALTNKPAFRNNLPLWAANTGNPAPQTKTQTMPDTVTAAPVQAAATSVAAPALPASPSTELDALRAQLKTATETIAATRKANATAAVQAATTRGALPPQDTALAAKWQKWCEETPDMIEALEKVPGATVLETAPITAGQPLSRNAIQGRDSETRILRAIFDLAKKTNGPLAGNDYAGFRAKGDVAREIAGIYASEIRPRFKDFGGMTLKPVLAADVSDTNLGILSGTLVAQRTLELFKLEFGGILMRIATDFSDLPASFKQVEATRIIVVPAVQSYDATLNADGEPNGWRTVTAPSTVDATITLDEHIGVPIRYDSNILAETVRRLFDEQAPAAAYALAKYFIEKIYKLFTLANFNAYAGGVQYPSAVARPLGAGAAGNLFIPTAYANYPKALADFGRSSLVDIDTIFTPNEVPVNNRTVLLNSQFYGKLATDPSLVTFFAGQRAPEIVTDDQLPKLGTFMPIQAPNLNKAGTPNMVGIALHRAAILAKTRLPSDYTAVLPGASYGSVQTVTDPDIGISVMLVQYVDHSKGFAEWRLQAMLGAAVGDKRGGLIITSQ